VRGFPRQRSWEKVDSNREVLEKKVWEKGAIVLGCCSLARSHRSDGVVCAGAAAGVKTYPDGFEPLSGRYSLKHSVKL
jgi:hypothetical protein